ncbi:MAG: Cache 3/Cache 2 fusion domain-containing protein [Actinomycetota bacterium]|nr:Cache 3/Cache 2 fusion domain-containing protein [Actinomycetota bacterium]
MALSRLAAQHAPVAAAVGAGALLAGVQPYAVATVAGALAAGVLAGRARPADRHEALDTAVEPPAEKPSLRPAVVADVEGLVRRMSGSSEQAVAEGEQLSSASSDLAGRFASVSRSAQALRTAIDEISSGAQEANGFAAGALGRSREASVRVEALRAASQEIDQVADLITSITGQTRMLALNATIEAARAGEAGKGFSVVAGEVKQLAAATARAAERITGHVRAVQDSGADAAGALDAIHESLRHMTSVQAGVSEAVDRQTSASGRIADDVAEASRASERIAELVEQRAAALRKSYVEQALEVAHAVLADAGGLRTGAGTVRWEATDQFSGDTCRVELPELLVRGRCLRRNDDPSTPSPFVDEVRDLVGGSVTLFQRMDEQGSMLRVATNVLNAHGRRAVGTYQPVRRPDGSANPVLAAVLAGRTFTGDTRILDQDYFTAYAPVLEASGRVGGAVFVGLRKD